MLSDGLRHPLGQSIEAEIGSLTPGDSRTVRVPVTADKPGRQQVSVRLTTPTGLDTTARAAVDVGPAPAGLTVRHAELPRLVAGRDGELRIEVSNQGATPLANVSVLDTLPDGLEFAGASNQGLYQPATRTVHWLFEQLLPGQTQVLALRVQGRRAGQFANDVVVRGGGLPDARHTATVGVENVADLSVRLAGDDALEQGRETVYEVHVDNPGNTPATNVLVQVAFAEGLTPRAAQAPGGIASTARS